MTKTVPERIQRQIDDLNETIATLCSDNLADSDVIAQAQGRIRDREATVVQLQAEVEIIRMGIAAFLGDSPVSNTALVGKILYSDVETSDQKAEPSPPHPTEPQTAQSRILRLLSETNRPMKAAEIADSVTVTGGIKAVGCVLSHLKRKQLITHLSESREWAIR